MSKHSPPEQNEGRASNWRYDQDISSSLVRWPLSFNTFNQLFDFRMLLSQKEVETNTDREPILFFFPLFYWGKRLLVFRMHAVWQGITGLFLLYWSSQLFFESEKVGALQRIEIQLYRIKNASLTPIPSWTSSTSCPLSGSHSQRKMEE